MPNLFEQPLIPFSQFFEYAMQNQTTGYYQHKAVIGKGGDFITAPEVSAVFGELIGIWFIHLMTEQGLLVPDKGKYRLVKPIDYLELGGGNGTLLADVLKVFNFFIVNAQSKVRVQLLETHQLFRLNQQQVASNLGFEVMLVSELRALSEDRAIPLLLMANEFFDALPVDIYRYDGEWKQLFLSPDATQQAAEEFRNPYYGTHWLKGKPNLDYPPTVTYVEHSPQMVTVATYLSRLLGLRTGGGLVIDYGEITPLNRKTLRGYANHEIVDWFLPNVDLTTHVNFQLLQACFGNQATNLLEQGFFLHAMGGRERLQKKLATVTNLETKALLEQEYNLLTEASGMGRIFKVLSITNPWIQHVGF